MPSYRGELGLPNQHAIAATHQGADSNEVLARRGRCVAHAEAWRGDGVASTSYGAGRVDDVALGSLSKAGRAQFFKSVLSDAQRSRARVVACQKLWGSPSGHFVCADRRWAPTKSSAVEDHWRSVFV